MHDKTFFGKNCCGIAAVLLCAALLLGSFSDYCIRCRRLREGVLRLHIIANSDSQADQTVKLQVRDALLTAGADVFNGSVSAAEAEEKLAPKLLLLEGAANRVLREAGFSYRARAAVGQDYFDTRAYGDITLPAGKYTALRVILGDGKGQNWFCVMFPPLCLPAAEPAGQDTDVFALFGENGGEIVQAKGGYKIKFRIAELAQMLWQKLTGEE